ncbi:MAG: hypothetical protein JNM90_04840 [Burkholderiales bacterium]|nr:hypothetical protein [Burkholderiales bacterium]
MQLLVHRTDGKTGRYAQADSGRAQMLARRLDPRTLFASGPIVIGVLNPFSVLNPDEVCWVEVRTDLPLAVQLPAGVDSVRRLADRAEYEAILARQWPRWRAQGPAGGGALVEALVELSFRGGGVLHLHVTGTRQDTALAELVFGAPAITATFAPDGTVFINPKCLVRARVYHSLQEVAYPAGLWFAEADDI